MKCGPMLANQYLLTVVNKRKIYTYFGEDKKKIEFIYTNYII